MHSFFCKELLIPVLLSKEIHQKFIPRLVGSVVLAMFIVINYAIGGAFNTNNINKNTDNNNNENNNNDQPIKK